MTETTSAGELNSCSTSWCVQPQAALSSFCGFVGVFETQLKSNSDWKQVFSALGPRFSD